MADRKSAVKSDRVFRLLPYYYIHVLDNNTNVTRVESGPRTFIRKDHEEIVLLPTEMINIPPRSYCIVANPHVRIDGKPSELENGEVKLKHGDLEVRLYSQSDWAAPFPLYPGEILSTPVTLLTVVPANSAIRLYAIRNFIGDGVVAEKEHKYSAGDEWLFEGPATYIPSINVKVLETIVASVIKPNTALKLRARRKCVDRKNIHHEAGDVWLVRSHGSYLPSVNEEIVETIKARVLTEKIALKLTATKSFKDIYGADRKAGSEWLITQSIAQTHIPDVYEMIVGTVPLTTLAIGQYCVVLNPVDKNNSPQWGRRELRVGTTDLSKSCFFLQPGEQLLDGGVKSAEVLGEEEALLLRAIGSFEDVVEEKGKEKKVIRQTGEEWMVYGPCKYIPPVDVTILERRAKIPLDENEGIYIRNKKSGKVSLLRGQTHMLLPEEELWKKVLPEEIERLLSKTLYQGLEKESRGRSGGLPKRPEFKAVTYRVAHNAAVQLYDYKQKKSRVVFGPELVMLNPDEMFTVVSLSGGHPKKANSITSLSLQLGPDFMTDFVVVETSDHARLNLKLSYNWRFEVNKSSAEEGSRIFSVRDFIGDACKNVASRVRGAVARNTFDEFHKNSTDIIRASVFGKDSSGQQSEKLFFNSNLLAITNVDIQSVEPVSQQTRDALQMSVQLALEIAANSQAQNAKQEAAREEAQNQGKLQEQKIKDDAAAESKRKTLVSLRAETRAAETTGIAKGEATARAEAQLIEAQARVDQAKLKAQAMEIRTKSKVKQLKAKHTQDLEYKKAVVKLEIEKSENDAKIEAEKFARIVNAIGADTIAAIASAGPEMQARLLEGLGLQGFLVTDGNSPINLFNTAQGLVSGKAPQ